MTRTDANPPMMPFTDEYTLVEVDADYLNKAVKPKQFIHIDQSECITCEGCVDICPWKCIHMVKPSAVIVEATGTEKPGCRPLRQCDLRDRRRHLHALRTLRRSLPNRCHHPRQGGCRPCHRVIRMHMHQQPRLRLRNEVLGDDENYGEASLTNPRDQR